MSESQNFFVTVATGLEPILENELRSMGFTTTKAVGSGVYLGGSLSDAYRVCLWSRVANKVLLPLAEFPAATPEELYDQVRNVDWSQHLNVQDTLAVDFFSANSDISHTQYGALKVKDAVVDQFREQQGVRPSVDRHTPSVRINVYVFRNKARLALDLAGMSLHRRGYRDAASIAPLKENLAAALLYAAKWPHAASQGDSFCDPMCGSGTFLIEAAMMAADIAPQLQRDYFGFSGWKQHDTSAWLALVQEAKERRNAGLQNMTLDIRGSDKSTRVVEVAKQNLQQAGLADKIQLSVGNLHQISYPSAMKPGLMLSNPPYGVRLEDKRDIAKLHTEMGRSLKSQFTGWKVGLLSANHDVLHRLRMKTKNVLSCQNGAIECRLVMLDVPSRSAAENNTPEQAAFSAPVDPWASAGSKKQARETLLKPKRRAEMFANRLRKNFRSLEKWARNEDIGCYRVYDADLPEYALAIDVYETEPRRVHVQEYRPPSGIDPQVAEQRLQAALQEIPEVLSCDATHIHLKERRKQSGAQQYEKLKSASPVYEIVEQGHRFEINLSSYLDTGIFADHRKIRHWIGKQCKGRQFLNLFAYTGTASVYAAQAGASAVTTVDMSANYLQWAERNMTLNNLQSFPHEVIRADCLAWLQEAKNEARRWDVILLDPPTFSNSNRMEQDWDVQKDHATIIRQTMRLLAGDGLLIFSNNYRKFRLDEKLNKDFHIENRTRMSIPRDFARNARIHQCYFIRHRK